MTPEILCNRKYAQEYVEHAALIRELLDQASLSTNAALLMRSSNQLLKSLGLTREPLPVWKLVKVVRNQPDADMVRKAISLLGSYQNTSINLPSTNANATRLMHPALVTHLADSKPYYMQGGRIPHLTKKGYFWKSAPPAIHMAMWKYRLHIDPVQSAHLKSVEQIDCGWTASLPKQSDYDPATGLHYSLGPAGALRGAQYWVNQDGTTAKAASLAVPPLLWNSSVQRLTQHFEHMSLRSAGNPVEGGSLLNDPTGEASQIQLKHDEVSWEYYSGHVFPTLELVPVDDRHHSTLLQIRAIGCRFNWTLNQEVVFSSALTGKPKKKLYFSQHCWKRRAVGTKSEWAVALSKPEWQVALSRGDLPSLQQEDSQDPLIFSPANYTEFLNVAAYLEAFWGYIWPTASHNNVPPHDEWKTIKHGGLREFIGHIVSTFGRAQLKPTTECLRGVATYPSGDQRQGRYNMTLTDLMNNHHAKAVREASLDLLLGRSDNVVEVGDLVEMLLGISFAVKDAMLDWEWLGIDSVEWPPQRLGWEVYRIEHLSFVSNMEAQFAGWLGQPWHVLYSALRCMACQNWQREHLCPICRTEHRNSGGTHDAWAYFNGCITHLTSASKCIGVFMLEDPLKGRGRPMTPSC